MSLNNLEDISFCETSTRITETDIISAYEVIANKKLYPGDPIRLLLEGLAYVIVQQRLIIDFTGKQNLLKYASGKYLDQVAALVGVTRLNASKARCTIKINISEAQRTTIVIPQGTRFRGDDLYFETISVAQIPPGILSIDVIVECQDAGEKGNGLLPGQIDVLVDVFPYYLNAVNISTTSGGSNVEDDESLRERAFSAPDSYSCAGSDKAYAFWAKSVSTEVGDVAVITPLPGEVTIIPISNTGEILSDEMLQQILIACTAKNVKPLTDKVSISHPTIVNYDIDIKYFIDSSDIAMTAIIQKNVERAIEDYILWQKIKLGRDINPSELVHRIIKAGAKRVSIDNPAFSALEKTQLAYIHNKNVIYGGIEDE